MDTTPQRILFLVRDPHYGGASRQVFALASSMVAAGQAVHLISNSENEQLAKACENQPNLEYYQTPLLEGHLGLYKSAQLFLRFLRMLHTIQPTAVISHGLWISFLMSLACRIYATSSQKPIQWFTWLRKHYGRPGSKRFRAEIQINRFSAWLGSQFVTSSESIQEQYRVHQVVGDEQINHIRLMYPKQLLPLPTGPGHLRQNFPVLTDAFIVGMIGHINHSKIFQTFISAMMPICRKYPQVHVVVVGDGMDCERLQRQIEFSGLAKQLHMVGYVEDMREIYADLNLSVILSDREGCANVLIESLLCGIPTVVNPGCGLSELISHDKNGFVVDTDNLPELTKQFGKIISKMMTDPDAVSHIAMAGQLTVKQKCSPETQGQQWLQLIHQHVPDPKKRTVEVHPVKGKKVLVLVHESHYGGGTRQTFHILKQLVADGAKPILVSNAKETWLGQRIREENLPITFYYNRLIQRKINPLFEGLVLLFIIHVILNEKPHIIFSSGVKLMGLGSLAGWLTRVPKRVAIVRGQGATPGTKMLKAVFAMEWFLAKLGTYFITVCEYDRQEMLAHKIIDAHAVKTIHNGTQIPSPENIQRDLSFREQWNIPPGAIVFGMLGRFSWQKRYDLFVEFMVKLCKEFPSVYGLLVADGEDREQIQDLIDASGFTERIIITGFVKDVPSVYRSLDVSVLFTHYEGCANVLLESAAYGVPMITEAVCGNPEIVQHEVNGFVVKPGDVATAVSYAKTLIQSPEKRYVMGQMGYTLAQEQFNQPEQLKKLVQTLAYFY